LRNIHASHIYLILTGIVSLAHSIMFTTYAVYYVTELGLNPLQLVLVGTVLEVTIIIFEGITGTVADTYSRRLSVIIGMFVLGTAYVLEGLIPFISNSLLNQSISLFVAVLAAEIIRGIGETFISGAQNAWISDEIGTDKIGQLFIRSNQIQKAASVVGIVLSVGLASIALNLPYIVGGVFFLILAVFLTFVMPETGFQPAPKTIRGPLHSMAGTFKDGIKVVRGRPILMMILAVTLFTGAASEGFARLWEAHFLDTFTLPQIGQLDTVVWFGIIAIGGNLLSIAAAEMFNRRFDTNNTKVITWSLLLCTALQVAFTIGFGLAGSFWTALVVFWSLGVIGSISGPMFDAWLNQNIESRTRATVLSIMSQSDAIGQSGGGPVVGAVGTRYSLRAAMVLAGLLLVPAVAVYGKIIKKQS
jgi:MFS family permease